MKPDSDEYMSFATENYQDSGLIPELEQQEVVAGFISMCDDMYLLHAESVVAGRVDTGISLTIQDVDGSELVMRVGEYTSSAGNLSDQTCHRYILFAAANYYGRIDDTYRYKLSEDGHGIVRHTEHRFGDEMVCSDNPVGRLEMGSIRELLLLGRPRYELR